MQPLVPRLLSGLLALGVGSKALGRETSLAEGEDKPAQVCWTVRTQAAYRGLGYDHIVEIKNSCDKPLACVVRTDVNPEATVTRVAALETVTVVTFHGSPSSEFKADVQCEREK